jgi:hypothetical protein
VSETHRRSFGTTRRLLLGAGAVILLGAGLWIVGHNMFPPRVSLPIECPNPVFLAHRSNSISLAAAAAHRGFCGLEVDIQWRDGLGIVVGHDELPATWNPTGALMLSGLLDSIPRQPFLLWLDFKNLSPANAARAGNYLRTVISQRHLQGRVIVESKSPSALWLVHRRFAGILPAYWIPVRPAGRGGLLYDAKLALLLGSLGLPALSIPQKQLTSEFAARFHRFALFTWTCNTAEQIRTASDRGARVILTDKAPPTSVRAWPMWVHD